MGFRSSPLTADSARPAREMPDEGKGLSLYGSSDPGRVLVLAARESPRHVRSHGDVNFGATHAAGPQPATPG
jgi:hypothetical protein